ncbi:MAG: hypothetical protein ACRDPM_27550 [Solirubrobacteraceae bacterium]
MDQAAAAYAHQLNDACVACGMTDGVRWGTVRRELGNGEVSEERYHTRKGSPCRRAYLRLIAGDERALTALRLDDGDVTALRGRATR